MGTGVGEAALAAEIAGGAEAATAGAGFLEGMAGVSALEGAGVAGLGLETGAGLSGLLGSGYGGASALAPGLQSAISGTAAFNPEIASQAMQAANVGAVPTAGTQFAPLAEPLPQFSSGIQNVDPSKFVTDLNPAQTAEVMQGVDPRYIHGYMPDAVPGRGLYDLGATDMSLGAAGEANAAAAAAPSASQLAGAAFDPTTMATINQGAGDLAAGQGGFDFTNPLGSFKNWYDKQDDLTKGVVKYGGMGLGALGASKALNKPGSVPGPEKYTGPLSKFSYDPSTYTPYTYKPYAAGGPVEQMSRDNALGANTGYPQADIQQGAYATPWQTPVSRNVVAGAGDANVDQMTGQERMAGGGIANLGGYSDGGRLLRGPGDGMSDNIPANISGKQPARLADGEFVVPADVVSGLGNGSTEAGAKQLYKMLDKVRSARTGTKKQGKQINPNKYTPA